MITEAILNLLTALPMLLLGNMEPVSLEIPAVVFDPLLDVIKALGSVVPVKALLPILIIDGTITTANILWTSIIRIKSFIPTMGA